MKRASRRRFLRAAGGAGLVAVPAAVASPSIARMSSGGTVAPTAAEIGTVRQNPLIVARDGVTTVRYRQRVLWLFGDTVLTVPGADGPYSTNFHWASNTMSWTDDLNAGNGITLENDWLDSTGAPTEFVGLTDTERAYNLAHKRDDSDECPAGEACGAEYVHWPGTMVADLDRDRVLVWYGKVHRGGAAFEGIGNGIAVWEPATNA